MNVGANIKLVVNGEPRELPADTTVAGLLESLRLRSDQAAVERNGAVVPRRQHGDERLAEGDQVEVVTFVGGG